MSVGEMCGLVQTRGKFYFESTNAATGDIRTVNGFESSRSLQAYSHRGLNEK